MNRGRRSLGLSLVETTVSISLAAAVLGGATALMDASDALAKSANDRSAAVNRVDRSLAPFAEAVRMGSLASMRHLDGSTFDDGESGVGFTIQPVRGFSGTPTLGAPVTYRLDLPIAAASGEMVGVEGAVETLLARGITSFTVSRAANLLTFQISSRSGPTNDRARTGTGSLQVVARNP